MHFALILYLSRNIHSTDRDMLRGISPGMAVTGAIPVRRLQENIPSYGDWPSYMDEGVSVAHGNNGAPSPTLSWRAGCWWGDSLICCCGSFVVAEKGGEIDQRWVSETTLSGADFPTNMHQTPRYGDNMSKASRKYAIWTISRSRELTA